MALEQEASRGRDGGAALGRVESGEQQPAQPDLAAFVTVQTKPPVSGCGDCAVAPCGEGASCCLGDRCVSTALVVVLVVLVVVVFALAVLVLAVVM